MQTARLNAAHFSGQFNFRNTDPIAALVFLQKIKKQNKKYSQDLPLYASWTQTIPSNLDETASFTLAIPDKLDNALKSRLAGTCLADKYERTGNYDINNFPSNGNLLHQENCDLETLKKTLSTDFCIALLIFSTKLFALNFKFKLSEEKQSLSST